MGGKLEIEDANGANLSSNEYDPAIFMGFIGRIRF